MPETFRRAVGYALNVFPYRTLAELWACLKTDVLKLKSLAFPDEPFPIELRLSESLLREIRDVAPLKTFFDDHDLALVTINAFVMPAFHGERVKERVYLPAWHESDARVRFTNACLDLFAPDASVSVPFGALKPVTMDAVAPHILRCAEHAKATGGMIALEPEPGLCVETTAEVIEFFERFVPDHLRPHLGVNFDLSHQLVQFEELAKSIAALQRHGVPIAKLHVSNAAEMTEWKPFCSDSIYLHQVSGADAGGQRVYFSLDWPETPPPQGIRKFRVHYHLPVFPPGTGSTLAEVEHFLVSILPTIHPSVPAIVETYTTRENVVETAARELAWVREKICLSVRRPQV
ncbi:MAG: TIM barrel protein [Verrucomicrobia bacterium]|nr:TIM barrel protein [Verrucomicrobiota bacterium]